MLTKKEEERLISFIRKIKNPHDGLPQNVCHAVMKIVPFLSCEIIITNNKGDLLLTWRQDQWWKGWHFPGGLMRYGESFAERIEETVRGELGVKLKSHQFLFPINYKCRKRGHVIGLVFLCTIGNKPREGRFFAKQPKDIIPDHRELWSKVTKFFCQTKSTNESFKAWSK